MEKRFKDKYYDLVTEEKIKAILLEYFHDVKSFDCTHVEQGYENINIIARVGYKKYVIRIYNDKQYGRIPRSKKHLLYELDFTNYLSKNGVPVANLNKTPDGQLFTEIILGHKKLFVILTDFVKGKQISIYNKKKIEDFAGWMAKIHKLSLKYEPEHIREPDGSLNFYNWWKDSEKKRQRVENKHIHNAYLPIMDYIHQFINPETIKKFTHIQIHADMHPGNIRFTGNRLSGIFDYDDTRHSIIPEDVGVFFDALLRKGNKKAITEKVTTFFTSYEKVHKLSEEEKQMSLYYALEKIYQVNYFNAYHDEKREKLSDEKVKYYLGLAQRFPLIKSIIEDYKT